MFEYEKFQTVVQTLRECISPDSHSRAMRRQDLTLVSMGLLRIEKKYSRGSIDASTANEEARALISRWL